MLIVIVDLQTIIILPNQLRHLCSTRFEEVLVTGVVHLQDSGRNAVVFKVLIEFRFAFDGFEGGILHTLDGVESFVQIDFGGFLAYLNVDWGVQIGIIGHLVVFVLVEAVVYQVLLREDVMDITTEVDQLANWNMLQQRVFLEEVLRSKKHLIGRIDG